MKIALVNSMFFDKNTSKKYINDYLKTSDYFFKTAKKYFLKNHDVDFITITNIDDHIINLDVIVKKIDYHIEGLYHALTMKVLCLEFIEDDYDFIFVADADQIFVNYVNDIDLLTHDYVFLRHFYKPSFNSILEQNTTCLKINFNGSKNEWSMGNFFGGRTKTMKELLNFSKKIHFENFGKNVSKDYGYYCKFSEEFFIGAFPYERNINYKILNVITNPYNDLSNDYFLSDFFDNNGDDNLYKNLKNVKILHNTKKNFIQLDRVITFFI